jgi:hypothetical protein
MIINMLPCFRVYCIVHREFFFGKSRAKINFTFKEIDSTETNVILIVSAEEQGDYGKWSQMTLTEGQVKDYYQKIFEGIESKL